MLFAGTGQKLADLHVEYEQAAEYPLQRIEAAGEPLNWRVEKIRLIKDKTALVYNDFLTLAGIPETAFAYRLGNRSALEWVIDQYQTHTDPSSGITNDTNMAAEFGGKRIREQNLSEWKQGGYRDWLASRRRWKSRSDWARTRRNGTQWAARR